MNINKQYKKTFLFKRTRSCTLISLASASVILLSQKTSAQPFLDIVNLKYSTSPDAGVINQNNNRVTVQYLGVGTNLPVQFKNKKDAIIFSPFFEKWSVLISNANRQHYYSIALPVTLSKTIPNSHWSFLITGIARLNDSSINKKTEMQAGGALVVNYKRNKNLTWKLGLYVNNELFGLFVMPLVGIDWRINEKNNLFGLLPGNLTYEHKINKRFYYGATFRAITNSYANTAGYWRIDENQLGLYLDGYVTKNMVLNVEAGHSLFRKIRTGVKQVSKTDAAVNDNLYFKIGLAYRVRFKNEGS